MRPRPGALSPPSPESGDASRTMVRLSTGAFGEEVGHLTRSHAGSARNAGSAHCGLMSPWYTQNKTTRYRDGDTLSRNIDAHHRAQSGGLKYCGSPTFDNRRAGVSILPTLRKVLPLPDHTSSMIGSRMEPPSRPQRTLELLLAGVVTRLLQRRLNRVLPH